MQMNNYVALKCKHMEFLIAALDGDPFGYVAPALAKLPETVHGDLLDAATAFLKRTGLLLEAKKQWSAGGLPQMNVRGKIPEGHRAQEGRILCVWGDAGWGDKVRHGKYRDGRYSNDLVAASVKMFRDWNPQPAPSWVTCVPSLRHPEHEETTAVHGGDSFRRWIRFGGDFIAPGSRSSARPGR